MLKVFSLSIFTGMAAMLLQGCATNQGGGPPGLSAA